MALFDDLSQALTDLRSETLGSLFSQSDQEQTEDILAGKSLAAVVASEDARVSFIDFARQQAEVYSESPAYEGFVSLSFAEVTPRRLVLPALSFSEKAMQQIISEQDPLIQLVAQQVRVGDFDESALSQAIQAVKGLLRTIFGTALAGVQRAVQNEIGKEISEGGPQLALYSGIEKRNTRPYCRALLDLVVDLDILRMTPNGQGLDPTIFGGGYNCTHNLLPVTPNMVRELGLQMATHEDYARARGGAG